MAEEQALSPQDGRSAWQIAKELSDIMPELTSSILALRLTEELLQATQPITLTGKLARDFVALKRRIKALEADIKTLKEKLETVEEELSEEWLEDGVSNVKVDGATVYRSRVVRANIKAENMDAACSLFESLEELPDSLVKRTINANSLTAWVKELPRTEDEDKPIIPDALDGLIDLHLGWEIKARGT